MKPLRVEMQPWLKTLAWAGIVFSSLCALASSLSGVLWVPILFLLFTCLGASLFLFLGPVEMDSQSICQSSPLGSWQMRWEEVNWVEISPNSDMVLHGDRKRLAIPGVDFWAKEGRDTAIEFFNAQLQQRSIPIRRTLRAGIQLSKNTKIAK